MEIVVLLLLLPAGGAAWAVRRLLLYPIRWGGWHYAFGREYRDARRQLNDPRLRKRAVEGEGRRRVSAADRRIADTERKGRERVQTLKREHEELLRPSRGEYVNRLEEGELVLYQHALQFVREAPAEAGGELWLDGLKVKTEFTRDYHFIHVTSPGGRFSAAYPRTCDQAAVRRFANQIHNQVRADDAFRKKQEHQAAEITAEIQRIEEDTAAQVTASRHECKKLIETQRPGRERAETEWQAACDAWEKLTGRRPQWWWRW